MVSPLYPAGNMKFKWLLMVVAATSIVQHSTATDGNGTAGNISLAKPGCQYQCGNVNIPYPFGMGPDHCFLNKDFIVNCTADNVAILNNSGTALVLLNIDANNGVARVHSPIKWHCNYTNGTVWDTPINNNSPWLFSVSPPFSVNSGWNKFTVIGCATVALANNGEDGNAPYSACGSFCYDSTGHVNLDNITNDCSGVGCCQAAIPIDLYKFDLKFSPIDNSAVRSISPCSYGFIADTYDIDAFQFDRLYLNSSNFLEDYRDGVPLLLDWNLYDQTCTEAMVNKSSYACLAKNSSCIDYHINGGSTYYCNCDGGFDGNPYLDGGCQDINECDDDDDNRPCINNNATCINTIGSYNCSCPPGTNSHDPMNIPCSPIIPPIPAGSNKQPQVKVVIGTSIGCVVFIICIFALLIKCQKRQLAKEKEKFFKQNGGHILYQQILSKQIDTMVIFTLEDLKKATNNYDRSRELGVGGHGTVYKGILEDKKVVAVKRSKIMNVTHTEEFVQEIIILSQLNHRNVVRLLGCCVETEVPILVYEYIPNGTLFQLIHGDHSRPPVSLEDRLRIAQESAEALAYLHLSIHRPIVHGDVKSLNILLDENYMAKVTDFGASRMLPKDAVQLMTMVQGTLGYLDPEYLQEQKLTEKSDVYSFGVVLLELITRKTAIYFEGQEEGKNLATSFLQALKHNRVQSMLDTSITHAGTEELFQEVIELARRCLSLKGSDRPSMTDVADKLKAIRSTWGGILLLMHEETHRQAEMSSTNSDSNNLSPSMYWTAGMLGVAKPHIDHDAAGTTNMHAMGVSLDDI